MERETLLSVLQKRKEKRCLCESIDLVTKFRSCHLPFIFSNMETKSSVGKESDLEVYVSWGRFERAFAQNELEGWPG